MVVLLLQGLKGIFLKTDKKTFFLIFFFYLHITHCKDIYFPYQKNLVSNIATNLNIEVAAQVYCSQREPWAYYTELVPLTTPSETGILFTCQMQQICVCTLQCSQSIKTPPNCIFILEFGSWLSKVCHVVFEIE